MFIEQVCSRGCVLSWKMMMMMAMIFTVLGICILSRVTFFVHLFPFLCSLRRFG